MSNKTTSNKHKKPDQPLIKQIGCILREWFILGRFASPTGAMLLFWPCLWGMALEGDIISRWHTALPLAILFFIGAIFMRGGGCAWNDLIDRKIDRQVARTKNRPLAAARISGKMGLLFIIITLTIGLAILSQLPKFAIIATLPVMALVLIYPFAKRVTYAPQLVLGMCFNWGVISGWAAMNNNIELATIILWVGGIFWTLSYDTIYAHQDKRDDPKAGVKSLALYFAGNTKRALLIFDTMFTICLILAIAVHGVRSIFIYGFIFLIWLSLRLIVRDTNLDDSKSCFMSFRLYGHIGMTIFLILAIPA